MHPGFVNRSHPPQVSQKKRKSIELAEKELFSILYGMTGILPGVSVSAGGGYLRRTGICSLYVMKRL